MSEQGFSAVPFNRPAASLPQTPLPKVPLQHIQAKESSDAKTSRVLPFSADDLHPNMLTAALFYASLGWPVLPLHSVTAEGKCTCQNVECSSIGKHPRIRSGVKGATTNKDIIKCWWEKNWPTANIGIATGKGLFVLDIDSRYSGSHENASQLVPPESGNVATGGNGIHIYYHHAPDLVFRNTASALAPGIDSRGTGGYVVAPPSLHASGQRYTWLDNPIPTLLPAWLRAFFSVKNHVSQPANVQKEKNTEATENKLAITFTEGARNNKLFSLAMNCHNWGLDQQIVLRMVWFVNKTVCQPPLSETEVQQLVKSATGYQRKVSKKVAEVENARFYKLTSMPEYPAMLWAIFNLLPEGVALLAGKPKLGKSILALQMALAIAGGTPFLGKLPVAQGEVLYINMEDGFECVNERACNILDDVSQLADFTGIDAWPPLDKGGLEKLDYWLSEHPRTRLVIIDPLICVRPESRNNGNAYADDYAVIRPLKKLASQYHVTILLIHHLRKNSAFDPMDEISGTTGLTGATDCNIVFTRKREEDPATFLLTGRRVKEQKLDLHFNQAVPCWELKETQAFVRERSSARQEILDLLAEKGSAMSPSEIAQVLGKQSSTVRGLLRRMVSDREVDVVGRGTYRLPNPSFLENEDGGQTA